MRTRVHPHSFLLFTRMSCSCFKSGSPSPAPSVREHGIPDETHGVAPWHTRDASARTLLRVVDLRLPCRTMGQSSAPNPLEDRAVPDCSTCCFSAHGRQECAVAPPEQ